MQSTVSRLGTFQQQQQQQQQQQKTDIHERWRWHQSMNHEFNHHRVSSSSSIRVDAYMCIYASIKSIGGSPSFETKQDLLLDGTAWIRRSSSFLSAGCLGFCRRAFRQLVQLAAISTIIFVLSGSLWIVFYSCFVFVGRRVLSTNHSAM